MVVHFYQTVRCQILKALFFTCISVLRESDDNNIRAVQQDTLSVLMSEFIHHVC